MAPERGVHLGDLTADALPNGVLLRWSEPPDSAIGYLVYRDSSGVVSRVVDSVIPPTRTYTIEGTSFLDGSGDTLAYGYGIAPIALTGREDATLWTGSPTHPHLDERAGWPKKSPKGALSTVAVADLDGDEVDDVVVGGRVVAAWHGDGSSATGSTDGLLFDPRPDDGFETGQVLLFCGNLAVADLALE